MKKRNAGSMLLCGALTASLGVGSLAGIPMTAAAAGSAFSATEFASPSATYQPGVRWWWPGGAVEKSEIKREIEAMKAANIGHVEINPFDVPTVLSGTADAYTSIYTDDFYDLLDYAITMAEDAGIGVSINMGSGWNANSPDVELKDTMGNMALGRSEVTGADLKKAVAVPSVEESYFYYSDGDKSKGVWDASLAKLQGVLIAEKAGDGMTFQGGTNYMGQQTPAYNEFRESDGTTVTYSNQILLSRENRTFVDAADIKDGAIDLSGSKLTITDGSTYEVIALYSVPSGGKGIDCATGWYVVDHMDESRAADYITDLFGKGRMKEIVSSHKNIDSVFNDSYEFYSDVYYTESLYNLAKDAEKNGLGYDFSSYLPLVYREYSAAPYYMGLGTKGTFFSFSEDEQERIQYDYNTLVGRKFAEGMKGFQSASNSLGLTYRQEAYNPPIDTIGSARYIDIPETEQGGEMDMIRTSSGSHLYGKNVTTAEQYTLGCVPFKNTLEELKIGFDKMATSGINNFNYHGYMYDYGENSAEYGENGWAPFPGIGMNASDDNTLYPYYAQLNEYAARVNYLMQQGSPDKDVAYYMPFNSSLSETDAVKAMNYSGTAWDAINDASITAANTTYTGGKISVNGGKMTYDAIVVDTDTIPVATMQKLNSLAQKGANIIFAETTPSKQPSYADGNYTAEDQKIADTAASMTALANVYTARNEAAIETALGKVVKAPATYERNENVRFIRRSLSDGSEIVYIRNLKTAENEITVKAPGYGSYYWLDQNTGKIYKATAENGRLTFTMQGSDATYTGSMGAAPGADAHSMAIALLCAPAGAEVSEEALSAGAPTVIDETEYNETAVTVDSLTVTDDNFDGVIGGEAETRTYTGNVLGKWNDAAFQNGELQTVTGNGVYHASYKYDGQAVKAVLSLGKVYTAASVKVNGKDAGQLLYTPYELDVTSLLKTGVNDIEITVTPRKANRYYKQKNGSYYFEDSTDWSGNAVPGLVDAGLGGPVTMLTKDKDGTMYRLYNPNSGEHFYTASARERRDVIAAGWNDEGIGWIAPTKSETPVYRLYNAIGGEHHYTTNASEKQDLLDAGWKDEGIGWYSDDAKTVPVYRQYNVNAFANNHNFTVSEKEKVNLLGLGWRDEGTGWYAVSEK